MSEGSEQLTKLCSELKELLTIDEVDPDAPLGEVGIDSLNVIELILACEEIYEGVIDPEALEFDEFTTLRELDQRLAC